MAAPPSNSPASASVAVITGAGSGIGRAAALALLERGFHLALLGRRREPLEAVAREIPGSDTLICPVDIADEPDVEATFGRITAHFGRIDLLFNNAGAFPARAPIDAISYRDWKTILDVNVGGAFLCARAAFRQMKSQSPQGGRIINNGSLSAHVPRPEAAAYTVSKHAITGLTKALLLDGRPFNIVAGQIDIGNVATELSGTLQTGALQPDGSVRGEPMMAVDNVAEAIVMMETRPLESNVPFLTIMASQMPFSGRG